MAPAIRSVTVQAFNYFSRSHAGGVRREHIESKCAWRGADLMAKPQLFTKEISAEQIAEVKAAVGNVVASGKLMGDLTANDFRWPLLEPLIAEVKAELIEGLGFSLVRGFPTHLWSQMESELFFFGWGLHMGICGAQDNDGEILAHVMDTGVDPALERQYKTTAAIDYHCDAADVVGLMCLQSSSAGGESTLVSSATAYNRFLERHPHLIEGLYDAFLLDLRKTSGLNCVPMEPVRHGSDGRLRTFWHNEYFRSCYGKDGAPAKMPANQLEVWTAYDAIIHEPSMAVTMSLKPGDVQMVSNHTVLHARTAYVDSSTEKRHLLRLWLSMETSFSTHDALSKAYHLCAIISRFVRAKVYARLGRSW